MDNKTKILGYFKEHKGEHVLRDNKIYQFVGLIEDDYDYYYVLFDGFNYMLATCVGRLTWLREKIDQDDYDDFIRLAKLNFRTSPEFANSLGDLDMWYYSEKFKEELTIKIKDTGKLLTELYWDFE